MFPEIAAAADKLEPGAAAAAAAAFGASSWGQRPAPAPSAADVAAEQEMLAAAASAAAELAGDAADDGKPDTASNKDAGSQAAEASAAAQQGSSGAQPGLRVVRPSAAIEALPRSAVRRALARAGIGRPQLLPTLHMAVLVAVAGVLVVCLAAYVGLGQRSPWVAITGVCARCECNCTTVCRFGCLLRSCGPSKQ